MSWLSWLSRAGYPLGQAAGIVEIVVCKNDSMTILLLSPKTDIMLDLFTCGQSVQHFSLNRFGTY